MPKTTLGVHLDGKTARIVRLKGGLSRVGIDKVLACSLDGDCREVFGKLSPHDTLITSLNAQNVFFRLVEVPFQDVRKAEQSAPLEAEESLPLSLEKVYHGVQVVASGSGKSKVLFVCAPTERVLERTDKFRSLGLSPHVMDAEPLALYTLLRVSVEKPASCMVLDIGEELTQGMYVDKNEVPQAFFSFASTSSQVGENLLRNIAMLADQGEEVSTIYITGSNLGLLDMAMMGASKIPVQKMPYPSSVISAPESENWLSYAIALGLALREYAPKKSSRINLIGWQFKSATTTEALKTKAIYAGAYLVVLLLLWGTGVWIETAQKRERLASLEANIQKIFKQEMPEVKNIRDEVGQLKEDVKTLEEKSQILGNLIVRDASPLRVLKEISQRIPNDIVVEFRDFSAEGERVRLEGTTTSFDAIDRIKSILEQYPWFGSVAVSDAKSGVEQDSIIFKLTITLKNPGS